MIKSTILLIENEFTDNHPLQSLFVGDDYQIQVIPFDQIGNVLNGQKVDAVLVNVLARPQIAWLRENAPKVPIIILSDQKNERFAIQAVNEGAQDYIINEQLNASLFKSVIHQAMSRAKLLATSELTVEQLKRILEDQKILHRIDRELGYTLNADRILNYAMDIAVRISAAAGCVVGWFTEETQTIEKIAGIGQYTFLNAPISTNDIDNNTFIGQAFLKGTPTLQPLDDKTHFHLWLPLIVQGKPNGLIVLEQISFAFCCEQSDWDFLVNLANRTAIALEKTRIYERTQYQARQMDRLYDISTDIARCVNRDEVIEASIRGLTTLLNGTKAFFAHFDRVLKIEDLTLHLTEDHQQTLQAGELLQIRNKPLPHIQALLLIPVLNNEQILGIMGLCESRYERYFTEDELTLARNLAGSIAVALSKADLFEDIRHLEQIKTEMIRMASHDIGNPLSRIYMGLAIWEMQLENNSQQAKIYNSIKESSEIIQNILKDILDLERIESGEFFDWQPIDIVELLQNVIQNFEGQAALDNQTYMIELPTHPVIIVGNEVLLRQAYFNYIGNAFKYTPQGGIIKVRGWVENDRWKVEVEDNGYGIPKTHQAKIFSRFFRAKAPGTERISGTGLGLSLVKTVIERHKGEVWFQSEENQGSIFGCWLPI